MQSVLIIPIYLVTIISIHDHTCILHMYIYIYIYIHLSIYLFIYITYIYTYIYMVTPPTAPRHAVCTVIYNITCSFFMFTFCGYLYMFIRTSSYKQKHNNSLILFGEDPWQRIKKIIEPTKKNLETLWEKTKKNKKQNKKRQRNQTHWRSCNPHGSVFLFFFGILFFSVFFCFFGFLFFFGFWFCLAIAEKPSRNCQWLQGSERTMAHVQRQWLQNAVKNRTPRVPPCGHVFIVFQNCNHIKV